MMTMELYQRVVDGYGVPDKRKTRLIGLTFKGKG